MQTGSEMREKHAFEQVCRCKNNTEFKEMVCEYFDLIYPAQSQNQ